MNIKKGMPIAVFLALAINLACSSQHEKGMTADFQSRPTSGDTSVISSKGFISSSAAVANSDSTKKFIRTAKLKFRVKEVRKATIAIEDITALFNGYVTYTDLRSEITDTDFTAVSADSSLESIFYQVTNDMVIRVPNTKLDSTLRSIAKHIDYLDYRIIKAKDVSLSLLSNKLTGKRIDNHSKRLSKAIDKKGKKLKSTTSAEENLLSKQKQRDAAILSSLELKDKIAYSTINLHFYQRNAVKRELIENPKNIDAFQPSFLSEIGDAIETGWNVLKRATIGLVSIWPVLLIGLGLWLGYWHLFDKRKSK